MKLTGTSEEIVERALAFVAEFKGDGRCALNCGYSEALAAEVSRLRAALVAPSPLEQFAEKLAASQVDLPADVAAVLRDNMWELIGGEPVAAPSPQEGDQPLPREGCIHCRPGRVCTYHSAENNPSVAAPLSLPETPTNLRQIIKAAFVEGFSVGASSPLARPESAWQDSQAVRDSVARSAAVALPVVQDEQQHCENCGAVGVELQELMCRSCWEQEPEGPRFHWRDGVYFQRVDQGAVLMTLPQSWKLIPANEWASIVAHLFPVVQDESPKAQEGERARLERACQLYCDWYEGRVPTLGASGVAYELVSAIRQALPSVPSASPKEGDRFIECSWSCTKCRLKGKLPKVWAYPGDTPQETARRQSASTRQSCIQGCAFVAVENQNQHESRSTDGDVRTD